MTGIIQAALAVALLVAGLAAFRAVQAHARDVQGTLRFGLPGLFVAGALVTTRSALRNLRMARLEQGPSNHDAPGTR